MSVTVQIGFPPSGNGSKIENVSSQEYLTSVLAISVLADMRSAMGQSRGDLRKLAGVWHVISNEFKGKTRSGQNSLASKTILKVAGGMGKNQKPARDGKNHILRLLGHTRSQASPALMMPAHSTVKMIQRLPGDRDRRTPSSQRSTRNVNRRFIINDAAQCRFGVLAASRKS
jgi:hypothetical protein